MHSSRRSLCKALAPSTLVHLFVRMPGGFAPSLRPCHGRHAMDLIGIHLLCSSMQIFLLVALLHVSHALHLGAVHNPMAPSQWPVSI